MNPMTADDIAYLVQQPAKNISLILSGMTSLMNDTDKKVELLQSQGWFKRMINTVTGKNKITQQEIQQNHDKLNMYMSQAIAELYNKNCIDDKIILSLGTQINEIYADHMQLKQMLGAFVDKLNEKIDSVDNFHMLNTEIEQGVYSYNMPIITVCMVISQFDNRMLEEQRKLDIIKRSLEKQNIFNTCEKTLAQYLRDIIDIPVEKAGQVYLELSTIRNNNYIASILLKTMEKYYFLSDMERKMKNKQLMINELIRQENIDKTVTLSIYEIYDDFVKNKVDIKNGIVAIDNNNMIQMNKNNNWRDRRGDNRNNKDNYHSQNHGQWHNDRNGNDRNDNHWHDRRWDNRNNKDNHHSQNHGQWHNDRNGNDRNDNHWHDRRWDNRNNKDNYHSQNHGQWHNDKNNRNDNHSSDGRKDNSSRGWNNHNSRHSSRDNHSTTAHHH